jgi:hypothetical protein
MRKIVLIIGQRDDVHVERVSFWLTALGAIPKVFDIASDILELAAGEHGQSGAIRYTNGEDGFQCDCVHSVWFRFKRQCNYTQDTIAKRAKTRFAWVEWICALQSLQDYIAPQRWVNPVFSESQFSRKGIQHVLAKDVGFRLPDTTITNDAESIAALFEKHRRVIYKPVRGGLISDGRAISTTEVDLSSIMAHRGELKIAPGIFQELIEKEYELRVTVVGECVFAVRINSQQCAQTQVDSRRERLGVDAHEVVTLDDAVVQKLLLFHKRSGLVYGAYDLAVTASGEHVFLEVNPAGQWLWLEEMLDIPITKQVAAELVKD